MRFTYTRAFAQFRFGAGAVSSLFILIPVLAAGLFLWFVLRKMDPTIHFLASAKEESALAGHRKHTALTVVLVVIGSLFILGLIIIPTIAALANRPGGIPGGPSPFEFSGRIYLNTFVYIFLAIFIQLLFSIPGGYALGRYRFTGRRVIYFLIVLTAFVLPNAVIVRMYISAGNAGLLDIFPVTIIGGSLTCPLGIILYTQFFSGSRERFISLASVADEASKRERKKELFKNVLRMTALVSCIYYILNANNLLVSLVLTRSTHSQTNILAVFSAITQVSFFDVRSVMAMMIVPMLPLVVGFIVFSITIFPKMRIRVTGSVPEKGIPTEDTPKRIEEQYPGEAEAVVEQPAEGKIKVNGLIIASIIVNAVLSIIGGLGFENPGIFIGIFGIFLLLSVLGAIIISTGSPKAGAILVIVGCAFFVPIGLLGVFGARRVLERVKRGK